ncbi:MAG: hypothetical protein JHD16_00550 [Solirubrobacteraceae bacterium]|nr:hypothetical protein [Solirubrobacteraceae bacterium]
MSTDSTPPPHRRSRSAIAATALLATGGCALLLAAGVGAVNGDTDEVRVAISDQLDRRPLFQLEDLAPGDQVDRCWQIDGQNNPMIRLWATSQGELAPHLRVTMTSGTSPADPSSTTCAGFQARDEIGSRALSSMPATAADALVDTATFSTGERRAYRLRVTVSDEAPQSRRATATFLACAQAPGKSACDPVARPATPVQPPIGGSGAPAPPGSPRCVNETLADGAAKKIRKGRFVQRRVGPGRVRMTTRVTGPYGRRKITVQVGTQRLAVRRVVFEVNNRRLRVDARRPYTATVPSNRLKVRHNEIRAKVQLRSGRTVIVRWGFHLSAPRKSACR